VFPTISVMPLDGGPPITLGAGRPGFAEWSADGERIVFVTRPQGTGPSNVVVQRLDGTFANEPDNSRFVVGTVIVDLAVRRY
jgi:Tol biopolymer transport system component